MTFLSESDLALSYPWLHKHGLEQSSTDAVLHQRGNFYVFLLLICWWRCLCAAARVVHVCLRVSLVEAENAGEHLKHLHVRACAPT